MHETASLESGEDMESFHTQVVTVFEPPEADVMDVEAYGTEGVMEDADQTLTLGAGEHVHMDHGLAHREAVTQNLEGSADMRSIPAPLAEREVGEDHTSPHEEGSQVLGSPCHLPPFSKEVVVGAEDNGHVRTTHFQS